MNGEDPDTNFIIAEEFPSGVAIHGTDVFWSTRGLPGDPGYISRAVPGSTNTFFIRLKKKRR